MQTRDEHLEWCKTRAMEYVNRGDTKNAFSSFMSDMGKHPETQDHLALQRGTMLKLGGHLSTPGQMKSWIEGFN